MFYLLYAGSRSQLFFLFYLSRPIRLKAEKVEEETRPLGALPTPAQVKNASVSQPTVVGAQCCGYYPRFCSTRKEKLNEESNFKIFITTADLHEGFYDTGGPLE